MIGPKKLSVIRQELREAVEAMSDDPLRWLEERMTAPERLESTTSGENEVLQSLRRIVETTTGDKRGRQPVRPKR